MQIHNNARAKTCTRKAAKLPSREKHKLVFQQNVFLNIRMNVYECYKHKDERGALSMEGGTGMCRSHDPLFFRASRRTLAYQFPINALLMCPPFLNFRKICIFSLVFCRIFRSQEAKFLNFRSQDLSFFKENPLSRSYFWKPVWHIPTKKS